VYDFERTQLNEERTMSSVINDLSL